MPVTAKIETIDKFHIQSANRDVLDVHVSFLEGEEVIGSKRFSLPLDAAEEDVKAAVERQLDAFIDGQRRKVRAAEQARVDARIEDTKSNLVGASVTAGAGDNET